MTPAVELRQPETRRGDVVTRRATRPRDSPPRTRPLRCRVCGNPVTTEDARTSVDGAHVHRRTNPYGIAFEFGCFSAAPGAHTLGPPTLEDTWFPAHAWRLATCRACGVHLGWSFDGADGRFWGLVLERLTADPGEDPS